MSEIPDRPDEPNELLEIVEDDAIHLHLYRLAPGERAIAAGQARHVLLAQIILAADLDVRPGAAGAARDDLVAGAERLLAEGEGPGDDGRSG